MGDDRTPGSRIETGFPWRGPCGFLYLLLEHQSTSDPDMPMRTLVYLVRIWERFRKEHEDEPLPLIIPAVVSHAPGGWTASRRFHEMFEPNPRAIPGLAPSGSIAPVGAVRDEPRAGSG